MPAIFCMAFYHLLLFNYLLVPGGYLFHFDTYQISYSINPDFSFKNKDKCEFHLIHYLSQVPHSVY